ncbi:eCIS core domain-containing protein [Pseudofrankia inefficax]|uniref:eCIS core domain-containing protein n=1 Tax=Pseudofrankia inefficax (strain DSM 45817 / CECT 9037 / DDB 130130 / EuI1c) TaxID=298654 RepID=UPI0012FD5A94|nr:DUF4157 domain-containing protein [Pseudofrankia inefficax]
MRTSATDPKQAATSAPGRTAHGVEHEAAHGSAPPARAGATPALLRMQRSHGNRHVQRVVASARASGASSARASAAPGPVPTSAGAGLLVGPSHGPAEWAADDVAQAVAGVAVPAGGPAPAPLAAPEVGDAGGALSPSTSAAVLAARSGGHRVPSSLLARTEAAVGADLGGVRLHVGRDVDALSDAMSARAFTIGQDVFVHRADYRPGTPGGDALIAHELAHAASPGPGPARVRRKGRKLGAAKAALNNIGISFAKTAGGPLYDLFHWLWYFKRSKKSGVSYENRVDLHPFKDLLKYAGNPKKEGGKAKLAAEDSVKRYGLPGIGHVLHFLRMMGSSLLKRVASYTSWLALLCTLIGFAPGAQVALPVAAALGTVALVLNAVKTGIDFVTNSWTLVLAWIRYICLDDPTYVDSPDVALYIESYKEYRKTRGELFDDALKLGLGGLLSGVGSAAQSATPNEAFVSGADKYFTQFASPSASVGTAIKNEATFDAHNAGEKFAAEKIPGAFTGEATGNYTSWMTKGRLEENRNAKLQTVGTDTLRDSPNVQMLLSANTIGKVNEQATTREAGVDTKKPIARSKLPGPPGTTLKGMAGLLVNPLGAIATILMMAADMCVLFSGKRGSQAAPTHDPGPPAPTYDPGPPAPIPIPDPPSAAALAQQAGPPKKPKKGKNRRGRRKKGAKTIVVRSSEPTVKSGEDESVGGVHVTPSAQVRVQDPADGVPSLDPDAHAARSGETESDDNLIRVPADLAVQSPTFPDTAARVAEEQMTYGSVQGALPSLSERPRANPAEISRVGVENFVVRELNRIRQTIADEGVRTREMAGMFSASRDAVESLGESSRELSKNSN